MDEKPEPAWHVEALAHDRGDLTIEIIQFLVTLEGKGYSPEAIGRVLGPIFGLYIRDHLRDASRFHTREKSLEGWGATMKPDLIEEVAVAVGYQGPHLGRGIDGLPSKGPAQPQTEFIVENGGRPGVRLDQSGVGMRARAKVGLQGPATAPLSANQLFTILREIIVGLVRADEPDLTMRGLGILLICYLNEEMQTVRSLAVHLKISKPSISRSLDRLAELNLIERRPDPSDGRSLILGRTEAGNKLLAEIKSLAAGTRNG
jgi:DNA-binding MarR family transcriptional regulator